MEQLWPLEYRWDRYVTAGVAVSIALHLCGLFLIRSSSLNGQRTPPENPPIMVGFEGELPSAPHPAVRPAKQIVSALDQPEAPADQTLTTLLSDKDTRTEREQIQRGDGVDAGVPLNKSGNTSPPPASSKILESAALPKAIDRTTAQKSAPSKPEEGGSKLKYLNLDSATLREKIAPAAEQSAEQKMNSYLSSGNNEQHASLESYQPFSRPTGSGARFMGRTGANDYLPDLPDGDITLLNAKADVFAVFVRRVATLVFSHLRNSGWEYLQSRDIQLIGNECTVRAVLSPQGSLVSASLASPSGSQRFDQVLLSAVERGTRDPNPPAAAAKEDGNIYFVFKARSWVQFVGAQRSGLPAERRWLVLATGLE